MTGRRRTTFPGWMPGLYRKVGKRVTTYYTIAKGKYVALGGELPAARRRLAELGGDAAPLPESVGGLLNQELELRRDLVRKGKLAQRTLDDNETEAANLKARFGGMRWRDVRKKDVWDYLHLYRGKKAPVRANREIALLQAAFKPLVATEALTSNPCEGVERNPEEPRDRKVGRDELDAFLVFARANGHIVSEAPEARWAKEHLDAGARVANGLELSFLTTKAQGQVLKLTRTRLKDEGVEWGKRKRGAPTITEWTPRLRECVDRCLAMPATIESVYVIFNRDGQPYTSAGFKALFQRIMKAWGAQGHPRFTFHDAGRAAGITKLRESGRSASEVSGHLQERTVARTYDRRTFRKAPAVE